MHRVDDGLASTVMSRQSTTVKYSKVMTMSNGGGLAVP
jgi:hypothetical protein